MLTRTTLLADAQDAGSAYSSRVIPGIPGSGADGLGQPGSSQGLVGDGSGLQSSFAGPPSVWVDASGDALSPSVPAGVDPLAAFLDGLHGLSSDAGRGLSSVTPTSPPVTMLSNGLNADAGVAQLVSALASVPDAHSSYYSTPFAPPNDPSTQGIVAPASHS